MNSAIIKKTALLLIFSLNPFPTKNPKRLNLIIKRTKNSLIGIDAIQDTNITNLRGNNIIMLKNFRILMITQYTM